MCDGGQDVCCDQKTEASLDYHEREQDAFDEHMSWSDNCSQQRSETSNKLLLTSEKAKSCSHGEARKTNATSAVPSRIYSDILIGLQSQLEAVGEKTKQGGIDDIESKAVDVDPCSENYIYHYAQIP